MQTPRDFLKVNIIIIHDAILLLYLTRLIQLEVMVATRRFIV